MACQCAKCGRWGDGAICQQCSEEMARNALIKKNLKLEAENKKLKAEVREGLKEAYVASTRWKRDGVMLSGKKIDTT